VILISILFGLILNERFLLVNSKTIVYFELYENIQGERTYKILISLLNYEFLTS